MTLRVIGVGYPRTGTASQKLALEQLGFGPCHHMREVLMNQDTVPLWIAAADGKPDWEAIYKDYQSSTDAPGCNFWRELIAYYPKAKVILSLRDPEKWFESTQATVLSPEWHQGSLNSPMGEFFRKLVYKEYDGRIHEREFMLARFERHKQDVIKSVPKERLLVFDVREGWEPLCKFLGVPVPKTPFPAVNSREEMAQMRGQLGRSGPPDMEEVQRLMRQRFAKKD